MTRRSVWMMLAVGLIVVLPLLFTGGEFSGADGQVADLIAAREGFAPWAMPLWSPPSPEIESLFFSVQAAIGGLVIGYAVGRVHGRARARAETTRPPV